MNDHEDVSTSALTVEGRPPSVLASDLPPGAWVEQYVVLQPLGKGGMGTVYAAYDSQLDRRVALKFLRVRAAAADADELRARMMREAKAMARLSHPNVVTLYEVGLSGDGRIFLAMEAVDGGTVADWLKAEKRSWRAIVAMFCQAGEGLAAAHGAGMIHRDFKLENVLLGSDGRPRVTDFGLARAEGQTTEGAEKATRPELAQATANGPFESASSPATSLPKLTLTGAMLGTPGYMAPEQYTNEAEMDARTDIFAFCATVYRALYGERPFAGETLEEVAESTLSGVVREAPKGTLVPGWVRKVLLRGLATEREARPASMHEVLAALRADPAKRRRRWLVLAGAVATACTLAVTVRAAGERRVRACRAMADRLGGVWDEPRRAAIASAFRATGVVDAEDSWARVEKRLNAYAAGWSAATDEACQAALVRGEQSEAVFDLQTACLDERLDELRALTGVFAAAPNASVVHKAVQAAMALPPLDPCTSPDRLSAATRLPSEPRARAEIRERQAELAGANALRVAGRFTQSLEELERIHASVEATKFGPVLLAWTMGVAKIDRARDLKAAVREWDTSVTLAETYHLDREKAESEVGLGQALRDLGQSEEAHRSMRYASATLARIGGDPRLELVRDAWDGLTYIDDGKPADGARILEGAIARAATDHVDDPIDLASAHSFLGGALVHDDARFTDAVTHARAAVTIMEDAFGPMSVRAGDMASNLAGVEAEVGRLGEALAAGQHAVAVYQAAVARGEVAAQNPNYGMELDEVGNVLLRLGRAREAADLVEQARTIARANDAAERTMDADVTLAEAWHQLGRLDDAARSYAEARAIVTEDKADPDTLGRSFIVGAALALDQGKVDDALRLAERAVTVAKTGEFHLYDFSRAHLVLARALVRGKRDASRARAVAEKAREGFTTLHDQPRVDEASALIAELR